jgi:Leucine-rich repeat (LRR) protein
MDKDMVITCIKAAGGYVTPNLNDKLYLHNNNFSNIGGLEEFTETKVIWLQSNFLTSIQGLSHLKKLRVLYLHQNRITSLDGLAGLEFLHTLNVNVNALRSLRGVAYLPALSNLYAAKNALCSCEDVSDIQNLKKLTVLDLSDNRIDGDGLLYLLRQSETIGVLTLQGNPLCQVSPLLNAKT